MSFCTTTRAKPFSDFLLHLGRGSVLSMTASWSPRLCVISFCRVSSLFSILQRLLLFSKSLKMLPHTTGLLHTLFLFLKMWNIILSPSVLVSRVTAKEKLCSTDPPSVHTDYYYFFLVLYFWSIIYLN